MTVSRYYLFLPSLTTSARRLTMSPNRFTSLACSPALLVELLGIGEDCRPRTTKVPPIHSPIGSLNEPGHNGRLDGTTARSLIRRSIPTMWVRTLSSPPPPVKGTPRRPRPPWYPVFARSPLRVSNLLRRTGVQRYGIISFDLPCSTIQIFQFERYF